MHVLVDIESLGLSPGAVIMSIGAVGFRPHEEPIDVDLGANQPNYDGQGIIRQVEGPGSPMFHAYVAFGDDTLAFAETKRSTLDCGTLSFWVQELADGNSEARQLLLPGGLRHRYGVDLSIALTQFTVWLSALQTAYGSVENYWAWPSSFDLPNLRYKMRDYGMNSPWGSNTRCASTVVKLAEQFTGSRILAPDRPWLVKHRALDDCIVEVHRVQRAMKLLRSQICAAGS